MPFLFKCHTSRQEITKDSLNVCVNIYIYTVNKTICYYKKTLVFIDTVCFTAKDSSAGKKT